MAVPDVAGKWRGAVSTITLGKTSADGGTRTCTLTVGGATSVPYTGADEARGARPLVAIDVLDAPPEDWPDVLMQPYQDVLGDPGAWAKKAVDVYGADLVCLSLEGVHPDRGDRSAAHAVEAVQKVLGAVGVPVIVWGCGNDAKDNEVMPKVSEAAKGENCLLGTVSKDNYKTLTAMAMADGHSLIAEAPLDINIAKQVNILVQDMGFPLDRVVMYQTTGALGYGLEYAYSIQERERVAALDGDHMMAMPVICDVGRESWRAKEAKGSDDDFPEWGAQAKRGPMWEAVTATALLHSGADILRMRHPDAVAAVKQFIGEIYGGSA